MISGGEGLVTPTPPGFAFDYDYTIEYYTWILRLITDKTSHNVTLAKLDSNQ